MRSYVRSMGYPMVSWWLTSLASGIFFVLTLYGCAPSFPSTLREEIPVGKTKGQIDEFFARQNNETGHWISKTVDIYSKDGKLETVNVYEWKSAPWHSIYADVLKYEMVFRDNELITFTPKAGDLREEYQNRGPYIESEDILRRYQGCKSRGPTRVSCLP